MPISKSSQRQEKQIKGTPSSKKHKWRKILFITAGLALISVALFYIARGTMTADETNMEKYLQDKYGQEFKVTDIKSNAVGIGIPGQLIGKAYPVNDSDLVFEVGKSRATGIYFDGYSGAVWSQEERPRVESFLKTVYGAEVPDFDLSTHIPTAEAPDPIRGAVPSINDAMARYKDNFLYSVTIKLTADHELSQNEMENHTTNIKKVIDFLLQKNVSYPMIRYAINIKDQNVGYLCNLSQNKLTDTHSVDTCLKKINGKAW